MGPKKPTKVKSKITIEASELESCDSTSKRKREDNLFTYEINRLILYDIKDIIFGHLVPR